MSRRARIGRMRAGRSAAAMLLAVMLVVPQAAIALDPGVYEHIWQAQTLFSGTAGTSDQTVVESHAEMTRDGATFEGAVMFRDLLGVKTDSQVTSQESRIELELTGTTQQGGAAAGGTFAGEVFLTVRDADTLAEAVDEAILEIDAELAVYEVSGHWGGTIDGDIVEGEILFERIEGPDSPASGPEYFNRANAANPDMLGDAQLFVADLSVEPGSGGTTGGDTGSGGKSGGNGTDAGASGDEGSDSAGTASSTGAFGYILKGLTGGAETPAMPVPDELAVPARALAEAAPAAATQLPDNAVAIDVDLSGSYLDAKNRAAGLLDDDGPTGTPAESARATTEKMRKVVPGIPAVPVDVDAALVWGERMGAQLDPQNSTEGVPDLLDQIDFLRPGSGPETVRLLRTWYHVAVATGSRPPFGSIIADAEGVAMGVAAEVIPPGAGADAVLAAASSPNAPSSSAAVTEFEGVEGENRADFSPRLLGATDLPTRVVLASGGTMDDLSLTYMTSDGPVRVAPDTWVPYTRADGAEYWLAGEDGKIALTDSSLRGWAFWVERAALVDAQRVGVWLAVYPIR